METWVSRLPFSKHGIAAWALSRKAAFLMQGKSLKQCKEKIKTNYKETFVFGSFFWPAANLINFRYC